MQFRRSRLVFMVVVVALALGVLAPSALAQDAKLKIGFVSHVKGNPFIEQIFDGARAAAADLDVELVEGGPEGFDPDAQLKVVQDIVAAGAKGVATSIPGESMAKGLNELIDAGTPIVQFNLLSVNVKAPYVGERSTQSGRILGQMVLDKIGGMEATGKVIVGICAPGFPVLENRAKGVKEALAAAKGLEVLGPFDVKVDAVENYNQWESLLAANPDAKGMIGLCAPDVASLGKLNAANGDKFVAGGYDLTEDNLKAIKDGHAYITLGQSAFVQGYLPVLMLVDSLRNGTKLDLGFADAGTQIVTTESVDMGNGLPGVSFDELLKISADPAATAAFYAPWVQCASGPGWACGIEPVENEGA